MVTHASLDQLETDLLTRMAAYRQHQSSRSVLPASVAVTACALAVGFGVGALHAQRLSSAPTTESIVADDISLAPAARLTSSQ